METETRKTDVAAAPEPVKKKVSLDEYYKAWEGKIASMTAASAAADWSGTDFSKLKAKDIGVHMGPVFTAEEFERYRAGRNDVHILRAKSGNQK